MSELTRRSPLSCLECHADIRERDLKSGPVWCSTGLVAHTICERSPDHHHHPDLGPDSGHTFRVSVESRGSYAVVGVEGHHDADDFMGPVMTVEVRAWNLPDALRRACNYPLPSWWAEGATTPVRNDR